MVHHRGLRHRRQGQAPDRAAPQVPGRDAKLTAIATPGNRDQSGIDDVLHQLPDSRHARVTVHDDGGWNRFGQDASMDIRAVAFDANGTLVKILTEDGMEEIFRAAAHFLTYQGIDLCRDQVRDLYFRFMAEQRDASPEEHPEFDAVGIWHRIITEHQTAFTRALPAAKLEQMPLFLAEMYRGISRRRLGLYPYAREVLDALRERYPLALVTDAQSTYARGELHRVGLLGYFDPIVVSGDHGYRKPDRRLFQAALDGMNVAAGKAMYVGNDMHRDIFGAREAGLTTVMFDSDQGKKAYRDCVPDYTITDLRDLLTILGI
jgi:putative hydrolase of the HAD superfamily